MPASLPRYGILVLLFTVLLSGRASAFDTPQLTAGDEQRLMAGDVLVDVKAVSTSSFVVTAIIDVPARRGIVWRVMTNCERSPDYVPYLRSCRVLKTSANRREDIRELIGEWGVVPLDIRSVVRSGYEKPKRIRFEKVAGDFAELSGEWRLDPVYRNNATRVTYHAKLAVPILMTTFYTRSAVEADIAKVLNALRDEIIRNGAR